MEVPTDEMKTEQRGSDITSGESVAGGPAIAGGTATDSAGSRALSVTRHVPFTSPGEWKVLACGIDSLDLGLQVRWGKLWEEFSAKLDEGKNLAAGTEGCPSWDGRFLILPSGKPPNYRWHLQFPGFHLYIGRSPEPHEKTPNVYVSINSQTLWQSSAEEAVALVQREIESFGGEVLQVKPSRCDLAADLLIPAGLSLEFLLALRVPPQLAHSHNMAGDQLETFYQGAKSSPIQLRIYDKALEVRKGGTKLWFLDVWNITECEHVWRFEFQLRRQCLKSFRIHTVSDLTRDLGSLWAYLTQEWFSLRLPDDTNTTRRTVHPLWQTVQECVSRFGTPRPLSRESSETPASIDWYVAHMAGCLVGFAARLQLDTFALAAKEIVREMQVYWTRRNYSRQYIIKSIQLGFPVSRPKPKPKPNPILPSEDTLQEESE